MNHQKKLKRQRKKERTLRLFKRNFHSQERVRFIKSLPCEVTTRSSETVVNAHTTSRGAGGTYMDIVPLSWKVHFDFDVMPEAKWELVYQRTKQSIRDRAPMYQQLWEAFRSGA